LLFLLDILDILCISVTPINKPTTFFIKKRTKIPACFEWFCNWNLWL